MQRLKLVLVLAVAGLLAIVVIGWLGNSQKIVVLDPVRTIPNQVAASSSENASEDVILAVSSEKVEVLVPGEVDWRLGEDGMEIVTGTRIRTDGNGRAEVKYPGGTVTRLDHESEIMVETVDIEESNIVVKILGGRIWSRVSRILGKVSYETRSTNVVASVRGTEYEHDLTSGVDNVMVAESSVDVSCINGKKRALLRLAEKMAMDCGDGVVEIKEVITSETLAESTESGEAAAQIKVVEENELDDDWRNYNGAREVIKKARQRGREELLNSSESAALTVSEKVKGELDESKSDDNDGEAKNNYPSDTEKRVSQWWSKVSGWRERNNEPDKKYDEISGKLRLKCEDDCGKLVLTSERRLDLKELAKIEIKTESGKEIQVGDVKQSGRTIETKINRDDICSGGEFRLIAVFEKDFKVEYGKFDSNDLDCKQ